MDKLLIFDLDDTIFETKSINKKDVKPIFDAFESLLTKRYGEEQTQLIVPQLWQYPFDYVSKKYAFGAYLDTEFARLINAEDYVFAIKPFDDFKAVERLKCPKVLVTTGFYKLQNAKIDALGIKDLFKHIFIDDIFDEDRIFKKGIFKNILLEEKATPNSVYVIGDNPQSELKAGYELGLNVVQMAKFGQKKSEYANHYISNFLDLQLLLQ